MPDGSVRSPIHVDNPDGRRLRRAARHVIAAGRRRWPAGRPVAGAVALVIVTPVLVVADRLLAGRVIAPADARYLIVPLREMTARAWREGRLPTWNPYSFSGSPVMAFAQGGALYPPQLAVLALGSALGTNVLLVGHLSLAGAGAFVLARRVTGATAGGLLAGVTFPLTGFFMGHLAHHNMVAALAWLPWMLVGFLWLLDRITPIRALGAGMPVALSALAAHPQAFAIAIVGLGLFAAGWLITAPAGGRLRVAAAAATTVAVGVAVAAPQLLVTAAVLGDSARAATGTATTFSFSYDPAHLPLMLFPHLFGAAVPSGPFAEPYRGLWHLTELNGYPGLVLLSLAALGIALGHRQRVVRVMVGVAVAALLLALGGTTPFGRAVAALPLLGSFRAWARYVVIVDLAVAVLAAVGLAELIRVAAARRRRLALAALVPVAAAGVIAVAAWFVPATSNRVAPGRSGVVAVAVPLVLGGAAVASLAVLHRRSLVVGAVCALAVLDLLASFGAFAEWRELSPTAAQIEADLDPGRPAAFGEVFDAGGGLDRFLYVSPYVASLSDFSFVTDAKQLRSASGQDVLAPGWYLAAFPMGHFGVLTAPDTVLAADNAILDVLRVTTVIAEADRRAPLLEEAPGDRIGTTGLVTHHRQPRLEDAFLVADVRQVSRPEALAALRGATATDFTTSAVIEGDCTPCERVAGGAPGVVLGRSWRDDAVDLTIATDSPALLVLSQAWSPGWRATVDGEPAPVVRTNALVQGVPVPAGARRVALRYEAPGLRPGLAVAVATLTGLPVLAGARAVRRRRRREGDLG